MKKKDFDYLNAYFPDMEEDAVFWGFTCFSRQDYAGKIPMDCEDQIMLGIQCRSEGCVCEMAIRWHDLGKYVAPRIECFDDAWPVLQTPTFTEVLQQLTAAGRQNLTPDDVSRLLIGCGFTDLSDKPLPRNPVVGKKKTKI